MRLALLILFCAASSSCGPADQAGHKNSGVMTVEPKEIGPIANDAEPIAAPSEATGQESEVLPVATDAIPAAFQGIYDQSLDACARPSDARLHVSDKELHFHESIGTVADVAVKSADKVSVTANYQGEGESWRSTSELTLSDDGGTLTIAGDGPSLVRVRCR